MNTNPQPSYRWLLWTLALLGCAVDQVGKYGVFKLLYQEAHANPPLYQAERSVIPGALKFHIKLTDESLPAGAYPLRTWSGEYQPQVNRGAFLGFGNSEGEGPNGNLIFAVVSVVAAAAIVWWSTRRSIARDLVLCVALGLILSGTLGNLYDRIIFGGVRDYLYWYFIQESAVFNLADFFLICGAVLLLAQALLSRPAREDQLARETLPPREVAHAAEMK